MARLRIVARVHPLYTDRIRSQCRATPQGFRIRSGTATELNQALLTTLGNHRFSWLAGTPDMRFCIVVYPVHGSRSIIHVPSEHSCAITTSPASNTQKPLLPVMRSLHAERLELLAHEWWLVKRSARSMVTSQVLRLALRRGTRQLMGRKSMVRPHLGQASLGSRDAETRRVVRHLLLGQTTSVLTGNRCGPCGK